MEGGAAAVEVLVQNLIDVTKGEISLVRGLKKNSQKLQNSLTLIQSYLDDAEKKMTTEDAVKTWLKQLEDVGFDAHNVLDELNYHDISKKMKIIRGEKEKVPSCSIIMIYFNDYRRRRRMALRINKIYIRFESSLDHATKLRLNCGVAIEYALPLETDPDTLDPIFIGRDKDVLHIVDKMMAREEPFSVLPIVGMAGLGKTTLIRKVFNHEKIKAHFGKQIWVHVSRDFDVVVVLRNILENLTFERVVGVNKVVLLKKLRKELEDKKYLLVLDDVWNEDVQMWEDFENSLSGITSTKGNFIVVTTRSEKVALVVRTLDIHNLNILSFEDCWSIIKQKALKENEDIPFGFESIGIDIVKRCQGLPLAANVVGGLLHRTPKDKWISIARDWLSNLQVEDNDISKILRLSFDHLSPPSLKRCFAYCSIFPKGKVIDKQQLIELWMAQGFLQIDPRKGMEVEGNKFFYFLVQNSLLQVAERDEYDNITHCSMHDLVHDLACIVSKGIYQVQYIGSQNGDDVSSSIPKERWRTLFYKSEILSDTMFSDFKSLHTLTLMDCDLKELPSSINELIHLRYLQISPRGIRDLPDSIGDLYHLQTLRADNDEIRKLPTTIQYLINLRHLHLSCVTELPPNIGSLTCLQTLEYYHVGEEEGHGIGELGKLKDLQGKLHISNLEKVHDRKEAESAHLFENPKIFNLVLEWSMSREGETNDVNVLEGLRPHADLKRLEIIGFKGTTFPSNMVEGLNNLMEVSLKGCNECEEIPMMGHLPHLKSLSLSGLRKVKSIRSSFKDSSCKERIVVFPVLQRLKLLEMPKLVEWIEIELGENEHPLEIKVFPFLEHLEIRRCGELRIDPSQFSSCHKELNSDLHICGSLTHLEINGLDEVEYLPDWFLSNQNLLELEISRCPKLRELPDGLESLNSLKINGLYKVEYLPDWFLSNKNLSKLAIWNCWELRELPNGLETLNSLKTLKIFNCGKLRELPDGLETLNSLKELNISMFPNLKSIACRSDGESQGLTSLESLELSGCEELISLPCEMLESCAPSLRILTLRNLSSLMNLPVIIDTLPKMSSLKSLQIWNVPKLISPPAPAVFHDLQHLWIKPADSDSSVDGILQAASHSLTELTLEGMEDWDSLPHSLQHLNALSSLWLDNFRIEELPEWFGNLTSLQTLLFSHCRELRSVGVTRCLKKLTALGINDCPILKSCIAQQIEDVSHIPNIEVDRKQFRKDGRQVSVL